MTTRRSFVTSVTGALLTATAMRPRPAAAQTLAPVKVGCVVLGDFGINAPTLVAMLSDVMDRKARHA